MPDLPMTILERLYLERINARGSKLWAQSIKKYEKLNSNARILADNSLARYFRACDRVGCPIDTTAILDSLDDAIRGQQVWRTADDEDIGAARPSVATGPKRPNTTARRIEVLK